MQHLPDDVDSTFRYILIAARRAEQLVEGARPRIETKHAKPATIALQEFASGKVPWRALSEEEFEQLREQAFTEGEESEDVIAAIAVPRPPEVTEPEEEEVDETAEFSDDIEDPEFDEDLADLEEETPELLEDSEG